MKRLLILHILLFYLSSCADNNGVEIDITINNHIFTPSVAFAPAGKKLILVVHNQDSTVEEFESLDLKREKIIPPHAKVRITLAPLKAGEYSFFGDFNSDTCQGKLIVKEIDQ